MRSELIRVEVGHDETNTLDEVWQPIVGEVSAVTPTGYPEMLPDGAPR